MRKLALLFFIFFPQVSMSSGHDQGNGGDSIAVEVVMIISEIFDNIGPTALKKYNLNALKTAIALTTIESTNKELVLDGVSKDAINYPRRRKIIFNQPRWSNLSLEVKSKLVLHEYLGIIGVNDEHYDVSLKILNGVRSCRLKTNQFDFEKAATDLAKDHCLDSKYNNLFISMTSISTGIRTGETHLVSFNCGTQKFHAILRSLPMDDCKKINYQFIKAVPLN